MCAKYCSPEEMYKLTKKQTKKTHTQTEHELNRHVMNKKIRKNADQ